MRLVTLVGGSGFIGRYAAQQFARAGWRVRVAVRRPHLAGHMRTLGVVGQVEPMQANIRDDASIVRVVDGADCVVNLVGILAEGGKQRFDAVQAEGAERVADAAKAGGVRGLVQVSAFGAYPESGWVYAGTPAAGAAAARAAYSDAPILRPSIVFGPEDQFFNRFAEMARFSPALPMVGADTRFQPVYVDNVAAAILAAAEHPLSEVGGKTFELGGPNIYTFRALMKLLLATIRRKRLLVNLPFPVATAQAFVLDMLAKVTFTTNGLLTRDQVRLLRVDNVVSEGAPTLEDLGVEPTSVEAIIPSYLWRFRPKGQFDEPEETENAST